MKRVAVLFLTWLAIAISPAAAQAGESILYEAAPAWVRPVAYTSTASSEGGALQFLLIDTESYYGPNGDEHYSETAIKVLNAQGLQAAGGIGQTWDPGTETLVIHKAEIIRDGKTIDLMTGGDRFQVLRRERNLNMAMLDGRLTATYQIEDLRVGDIIHVAISIRGKDPALAGKSEFWDMLHGDFVRDRLRYREVWDKSKKIRWRTTEGFGDAVVSQTPLGTELVVDRRNVETPEPPQSAPGRFDNLGQVEISEFADWKELSALFAPLYGKAATLAADSPLKAEVAKIKAAYTDPADRTAAALRLVEDKVRYLYVAVGQGGYVPAVADETWNRRFGDCKGKTVLLLAMLREMGIKADPALVSTTGGDGLDAHLPRAGAFDHVLVRAEIGGKVYWLDGTRIGDRTLADVPVPAFYWALPLRTAGAALEKLEISAPTKPLLEWLLKIDASAGLGVDAPVTVEILYRGEAAIAFQQQINSLTRAQAIKNMREAWGESMPWLTADKIDFGLDEQTGVMRVAVEGKGKIEWATDTGSKAKQYVVADSGFALDFDKRRPGPHADAPFALNYPNFSRYETHVRLPRKGEGFRIVGDDVDKTVASVQLTRKSKIVGDEAVIEFAYRYLASELSATEAYAAGPAFEKLPTANFVRVRAPADFIATKSELDTMVKQHPEDAATYIQAGYALEQRGEYADAITQYDRAIALAPANELAWRDRAEAKALLNKPDEALADAAAAIRLEPDSAAGYIMRAWILDRIGRTPEAIAALDESERRSSPTIDLFRRRALMHRKTGDLTKAAADLDAAIKLDPADVALAQQRAIILIPANAGDAVRMPPMLAAVNALIERTPDDGGAYLQRAQLYLRDGKLDLALADADKAIALSPSSLALQFRATIHARKLDFAAAGADYDAIIKLEPGAFSYVLRSGWRIERRDFDGAESDVLQALKMDPDLLAARTQQIALASERGDNDRALSLAETMVRERSGSADTVRIRAEIFTRRKEYPKAIADYESLLALTPNDQNMRNYVASKLARIHESAGDYAAAVADYDRLLASNTPTAMLYNQRCWLKATRSVQSETAVADCDKGLELDPGNSALLDSRGFAHLRSGEYAKAVADYDAALVKRPGQSESLYGRAMAKRAMGDPKGADADMAAAEKADPKVAATFAEYKLVVASAASR